MSIDHFGGFPSSGNTCSLIEKLGQTWRNEYKMVTTKKCAWGTCKSDSRYPDRLKRGANGSKIFFLHFPGTKYHSAKRERWIRACHRGDGFVCTKDSYICSLHFVGENGPTMDHPDPISAVKSTENVSVNRISLSILKSSAYGKYVKYGNI